MLQSVIISCPPGWTHVRWQHHPAVLPVVAPAAFNGPEQTTLHAAGQSSPWRVNAYFHSSWPVPSARQASQQEQYVGHSDITSSAAWRCVSVVGWIHFSVCVCVCIHVGLFLYETQTQEARRQGFVGQGRHRWILPCGGQNAMTSLGHTRKI